MSVATQPTTTMRIDGRAMCGAKRRNGEPCRALAMANGRCRLHGGTALTGVANPAFKTGRYSKHLPDRLLERYHEAADDPHLLELDHDIALVDARLADLLSRVDTGEAGANWTAARKANDDIRKALLNENYGALMEMSLSLDRIIGTELTDIEAWEQVHQLIDQRRRLVESQRKRLIEQQQMITADQAMTFVAALLGVVKNAVTDRVVLNKIQMGVNNLLMAGNETK